MLVTLWGTRGSVPCPGPSTVRYGGNTSCVEVRLTDGTELILDAGTGIRPLGRRLVADDDPHPVFVLVSHAHWDHVHGFPFFQPAYRPGWEIHVAGWSHSLKAIQNLLHVQMDGFNFPVDFGALRAEIDFMDLGDSAARIRSAQLELGLCAHPGGCSCFRIAEGDSVLVHVTDNELSAMPADGPTSRQSLLQLCRGADLLIHDAQFTPRELTHHVGWGHSSYQDALDFAAEAGVPHLLLFHHDPDRTDEQLDEIEWMAQDYISRHELRLQCEIAREGMQVCL